MPVDTSAFHDEIDSFGSCDVEDRISGDRDDVCLFARREREMTSAGKAPCMSA
jgi:hypothetical protein